MRAMVGIVLAGLLCVDAAWAQRPPRPPRPGAPGEPRPPEPGRGEGRPPEPGRGRPETRGVDRDVERFLDEASDAERKAFDAAGPSERASIVNAWGEARRVREEAAFLDALPKERRDALDAVRDPVERKAAIVALRLEFAFERAAEEAVAAGVATQEDVARWRAAPLKERAEITLDLRKRTLLVRLKPEFDRMPPHVRDELAGLSPRRFFEHPEVDDLRNFRFFTRRERDRLRGLSPEERTQVAEAIEKGESHPRLTDALLPERLQAMSRLPERARSRLAREIRDRLGSTSRPSGPPGGPPPPRPPRGG